MPSFWGEVWPMLGFMAFFPSPLTEVAYSMQFLCMWFFRMFLEVLPYFELGIYKEK